MCWGHCCWEWRPSRSVTPPPSHPSQSFSRIKKWLEHARSSPSLTILAGGKCDDSVGYFVEPCIVKSEDPQEPIMKEVSGAGSLGHRRQSVPRAQCTRDPCVWLPSCGATPFHRWECEVLERECLVPSESGARPWTQAS